MNLPNLHIAVLLTNNDTSAFAAHFPNDGRKVVQLLQSLRPDWSFEVLSVKDGVPPFAPDAFDGGLHNPGVVATLHRTKCLK